MCVYLSAECKYALRVSSQDSGFQNSELKKSTESRHSRMFQCISENSYKQNKSTNKYSIIEAWVAASQRESLHLKNEQSSHSTSYSTARSVIMRRVAK